MNHRILIVDDHPAVRIAIRLVLSNRGYCISEAENGEHALALLEHPGPVTLILDIAMPHVDGLEVIRSLRRRKSPVKIVVMTGLPSEHWSLRCRRMGAHGFVSKQDTLEELVTAVSAVHANQLYFPTLVPLTLSTGIDNESEALASLSKRELMIMHLFLQGMSGKEIATHLGLSEKTVSGFKRRIFTKLNISSLMELYALGKQHRLT